MEDLERRGGEKRDKIRFRRHKRAFSKTRGEKNVPISGMPALPTRELSVSICAIRNPLPSWRERM